MTKEMKRERNMNIITQKRKECEQRAARKGQEARAEKK